VKNIKSHHRDGRYIFYQSVDFDLTIIAVSLT